MSNKNQIKIKPVTEEEYMACTEWNRQMLEEFLNQAHLSDHTIKQYRSAGRIFLRWIKDYHNNLPIYKLKSRHAMLYQNWLNSLGLSSSIIRMRRSVVSSLSDYIELYYGEDYPEFRNIFSKAIENVPHVIKREKEPLTMEEWQNLIAELEKRKEWQLLAYVMFSYWSSARRSEVAQIKKEVADYDTIKDKVTGEDKGYYQTHSVRAKGRGKVGNVRRLVYGQEAQNAIKKWLEYRGEDDCEYLFVQKRVSGKATQLSPETFNDWCSGTISEIVGRPIYPHLFRSTRATHLVVYENKDIKTAQNLLGHKDSSTTEIYIVDPNADDVSDAF